MASLDSLYAEKNQYQTLRSDVSELASKLSASVDALTSAANIQNNYSINDSSPESGIIKIRQEQLQQKKDTITTGVIPAIDGEISRIDTEIEAEKRRIEEEKRRREEEERRAREEAEASMYS